MAAAQPARVHGVGESSCTEPFGKKLVSCLFRFAEEKCACEAPGGSEGESHGRGTRIWPLGPHRAAGTASGREADTGLAHCLVWKPDGL